MNIFFGLLLSLFQIMFVSIKILQVYKSKDSPEKSSSEIRKSRLVALRIQYFNLVKIWNFDQ